MQLIPWAASNAELLLSPLDDRWPHVRQVSMQARRVAEAVPAEDRDLLVAAGYLHDVGYATELAMTGFHPLDGARWIRSQGQNLRLARLVAHHSCARYEAQVRGLLDVLLAEFEPEDSETYDALVFCDMTTGPTGKTISFEERIEDIYQRYGPNHEVSWALDSSLPCLKACHDRTIARLADSTPLANVGSATLEVVLDAQPY
jgi:HD domain